VGVLSRLDCVTLAALTLVACAGEFREPAPPGSETAAPADSHATPAPSASPASPAAPAAPTPASTDGAAPATSASAAASVSPVPPPAAVPPPATNGTISGTVTAQPAALGGHNVILYLADGPPAETKGMTATVDQHGMAFIPLVTPIVAGGKVAFLNSDPFPHNVFSPDGEKFNIGTVGHGGSVTHQFAKTGAYTLLCNLHTNMIAYVLVVPSSYFVRADKDGKYSMKDVPPGTYKLMAWGPRFEQQSKSVTVTSGDVVADFQLHR
jgi:plastocyanin